MFKKISNNFDLKILKFFQELHTKSWKETHVPRIMKCDSQASLLARTFTSLYFGRKPKAKVMTFLHSQECECDFFGQHVINEMHQKVVPILNIIKHKKYFCLLFMHQEE
jgi:hypothetical protein